jgi:hypothetical protein
MRQGAFIAAVINDTLPAAAKKLGNLLLIEGFQLQLSLHHSTAQVGNQPELVPASHTAVTLLSQPRGETIEMWRERT